LYLNIREDYVDLDDSPPPASLKKSKGRKSAGNGQKSANSSGASSSAGLVRKCAYCHIHTPLDVLSPRTRKAIESSSSAPNSIEYEAALEEAQRVRMKRARKQLRERRNAPPVVSLPVIPDESRMHIMEKVAHSVQQHESFFARLMDYWLLKRHSRNGVPLLRRLQLSSSVKKNSAATVSASANVSGQQQQTGRALRSSASQNLNNSNNAATAEDTQSVTSATKSNLNNNTSVDSTEPPVEKTSKQLRDEFREHKSAFLKLRHDVEKARLCMELIKKRERYKRELVRLGHMQTMYEVNPFNGVFLQRLLDILVEYDRKGTFVNPVNPIQVPSYYDVIKDPMDFSCMQERINALHYQCLDQFEVDVRLIVNNCMKFNPKNSFFYREAQKLRDKVEF
jgi:hypothetical protein